MADTAVSDTLATARKLKAAGIADAQAEAHAEAIADAVRASRSALATKADLYHALWVHTVGLAAFIVAVAGLAIGLIQP